MTAFLDEAQVEIATVGFFQELGYGYAPGPHIAPGEPSAERRSFSDVVLQGRLREAVTRLNPTIPAEAREDAVRRVLHVGAPSLNQTNRTFHTMLREGVEVEYRRKDGSIAGDRVRLVDFADYRNNDFLVVNQFTVLEGQHNRRADVVVFINGLPLAVVELKNPADETATVWSAFHQLQTYKHQIPSLFHYNELLIVSDGTQARIGSLTANQEWFKVWRQRGTDAIVGKPSAAQPKSAKPELETLIKEVFDKQRLLDIIRHFIVFEEDTDSDNLHKIIAGYHQFQRENGDTAPY